MWYRVGKGSNNAGDAGLEFYTINTDGSKSLVNDSADAKAIKAYSARTAGTGTYVKYAGPSSFVSPFVDSSDVGFKTMNVIISDGTTNTVTAGSAVLKVDGTNVTATPTAAGGGRP